ncbi:MAG: tetratricopeptide repeat protein [Cyanobacteria bacterium REEB67]|nr:tetratricopeptide repeat protein [Cyanobacteria bacterium REEB67]
MSSVQAPAALLKVTLACLALALGATFYSPLRAAESTLWSTSYAKGLAEEAEQKPEQAVVYFKQALAQMQTEVHQQSDLENCLRRLGNAQMLHGQTREANATYSNLLSLLSKHYGAANQKVAPVLILLGSVQESLGDHQAAMEYYRRALKINEKNYGVYSPEFAGNLHKLGKASARRGDKVGAEKNYKQALAILSTEPGLAASSELKNLLRDYSDLIKVDETSSSDLVKDFNSDIYGASASAPKPANLAGAPAGAADSAWQKQSDFQLKVHAQGQVGEDPQVELRGINAPTSEQNLSPVFKTMSETIFHQSHFEKGEAFYKRKIAIDIEALGSSHPTVANDLCGLAIFYLSEQKYGEARPLLLRALPIYRKAWGENNLLTINTLASLASAEFHLGNVEVASSLYKDALSRSQSALGPNNLETARILNELAYLYFHQGRLADACTFYEWALASTESAVGQKDPLVAACLKDYALVLKGLGRASEAGAVESRAESILVSVH